MGFWDRPVKDSLDELFDLDRNGLIDPIEEGFKLDFIFDNDDDKLLSSSDKYDDDEDDDDF